MSWPLRLLPQRLRVRALSARNGVRQVVDALTQSRFKGVQPRHADVPCAPRIEVRLPPPPISTPASTPDAAPAQSVAVVQFADHDVEVTVLPGQTILQAGLGAGVDLLYSCTLGGCGACMLHVLEGEVEYDDPDGICLSEREREEGMCLACVGRPRGRVVVEG